MTSDLGLDRPTVEAALTVAVRAPSIHNTQPWRWRLGDDGLLLLADRSRQLQVADPDGHSLLISCGAALTLTELALQAQGRQVETERLPDAAAPDVLARFRVTGGVDADQRILDLVAAARRRRSDRRPFAQKPVPSALIEQLRRASSDAVVHADFPEREEQRVDLAVAVGWADRIERDDEAYKAEMNRWLRDPDVHATSDGIPLDAVPRVSDEHPRHTDVPLRDFEVGVNGRQLIERDVDERPLIGVLFTESDTPADHLRSGEAMMRLMLQAELSGLATCPLSQAVDFAAFRTRVQGLMGWVGFPQMMLRLGYPGQPLDDLAFTPRRDPAAVLDTV